MWIALHCIASNHLKSFDRAWIRVWVGMNIADVHRVWELCELNVWRGKIGAVCHKFSKKYGEIAINWLEMTVCMCFSMSFCSTSYRFFSQNSIHAREMPTKCTLMSYLMSFILIKFSIINNPQWITSPTILIPLNYSNTLNIFWIGIGWSLASGAFYRRNCMREIISDIE